jgi:hypothetical protein
MKAVAELVALVQTECDSVLPFFDPFSQLGNAYAALDRMEQSAEFDALFTAAGDLPGDRQSVEKLNELRAARAWLMHMALAFSSERTDGKWPELLKHEAQEAIRRVHAALARLSESSGC